MRKEPNLQVEKYRVTHPVNGRSPYGANWGAFIVPRTRGELRVIVGDSEGWDHVSVSLKNRCPTWDEMSFIKSHWFREDEWAVEFHPAASDHINVHPYCLHIWRPHNIELPKPPKWMIA